MLVPVGVPGYHCSSGTLVDGELPRNRGHRGVHILWGGLPCVPPPSKDGESPSNPNVPCSMGGGRVGNTTCVKNGGRIGNEIATQ